MSGKLGKIWRNTKLALGGMIVLVSLWMMLAPNSQMLERLTELEQVGQIVPGKITNKTTDVSYGGSASSSPAITSKLGPVGGMVGGFQAGKRLAEAMDDDPSNDGVPNYTFTVEYEYRPSKDQVLKKSSSLTAAQYDAIKVGSPVEVLYHPEDPAIQRLLGYSNPINPPDPMVALFVAMLVASLGIYLLIRNWPYDDGSETKRSVAASAAMDRAIAAAAAPPRSTGRSRPAAATRPARRQGFGQRG